MNELNRISKLNRKKFYDRRRQSNHSTLILYSAISLLLGMMILTAYMIWHYYSVGQWTMDASMQDFMRDSRTPWLTPIFLAITATGETIPVIIATGIIIIALVIYKRRKEAVMLAIYMLGVWRLNDFLKSLLQRPRIDPSQHLVDISGYSHNNAFSLPSGHSMNFMALVLLSLYLVWIFSNNKKLNFGVTLLFLPYAILVGISRVYLNVHYFSDIITGWSVGAACTAIAIIIHSIMSRNQNKYSNYHH